MEMRRHDDSRPQGERALLSLYWAVSGYGLRASRALGWLLFSIAMTITLMVLWGLPQTSPKPETTGRIDGQRVALTTDRPEPLNPTDPPLQRLTRERFEKALRITTNSVVFRSSGQNLTTSGTYIEMGSRFVEPILLGLCLLAIRGRVKR